MKRFDNKVVLVTGAGAGIGRAAAEKFAAEGAKVVCNSVDESARPTAEQLAAAGAEAIFIQGNIANEDDVRRMVDMAVDTYGRIDVLINNAGIVRGGTVENTTVSDFRLTMDINVIGTFLMSQYTVPYMLKQGGGVIVNTASVAGLKGHTNRISYAASKGAVIALTKSMATELCGKNIRVNCVCPGTTLTPSLKDRINASPDPEATMAEFCARQPIGRLGDPSEIAEAILFAACDQAAYMTGASIIIDGGMTM